MKTFQTALFLLLATAVQAAIPLHWTVDAARPQPREFTAYHGETLELKAAFTGASLPDGKTAALYWQTNGMGGAWWSKPAAFTESEEPAPGGRGLPVGSLSAVFTPEMDTGAALYNCFLGVPGENYRAAFRLRLLPSPGFEPNLLDAPPRVLDLSTTTVVNPPWPTDETIADTVRGVIAADGISAGTDGAAVTNIVRSLTDGLATENYVYCAVGAGIHADINSPGGFIPAAIAAATDGLATAESVSRVYGYFGGSNVWLSVTNYDSVVHSPRMSLKEIRDGAERTVWDESRGLAETLAAATNHADTILADYAIDPMNRAWGRVQSASGLPAPDGNTWVTTPAVVLSGGLEYRQIETSGVWVLVSNGLAPRLGADPTSGFFRVTDDTGEPVFEIAKTDSALVGATAQGVTVNTSGGSKIVTIPFAVNVKPDLYIRRALDGEEVWQKFEATPGPHQYTATSAVLDWTQENGSWIAHVDCAAAYYPQAFFKAEYLREGTTTIVHHAPASFERIVVGGTVYSVAVETVGGRKLLVLEEAQ